MLVLPPFNGHRTIGCAIAMVKIDETYAIISMIIAGAVYFYFPKTLGSAKSKPVRLVISAESAG